MEKTQWYIGAPNGVVLCVNGSARGQLRGILYHSYSLEGFPFRSIEEMIFRMAALYDELKFPHQSTTPRSFSAIPPTNEQAKERKKIMSDENLLSKHGDIGTFIVRVQYRQNSSWQGRITWMEEDKTINFRSIWEMIRLMESAIDTVSIPDDDTEADPNWFDPSDK